jgi:hypothetical protein
MNTKSLFLVLMLGLVGCTSIVKPPPPKVIEPYRDLNSYLHGNWILLAESLNIDWFYDPESLMMDEDYTVSFWSYWAPNQRKRSITMESAKKANAAKGIPDFTSVSVDDEGLFDREAIGPYLQKINCFSNTQSSESLINQSCDLGPNTQAGMVAPGAGECWHFIKPQTAMAYIKTRVCGRKFVMDANTNYFLYQTGRLPSAIKKDESSLTVSTSDEQRTLSRSFEVINNEYIVVDAKNNIREMRIATYVLDKKGAHDSDYIYRASCNEGTDTLTRIGQPNSGMRKIGDPSSLSGVAFNRICGDHGDYMTQVKALIK